jgi:hypothetical protein
MIKVSVKGVGFVYKYSDRYVLVLDLWSLSFEDVIIV